MQHLFFNKLYFFNTEKSGFFPAVYSCWQDWQMVPLCPKWWCSEANETTETHCNNPGTLTYPIWAQSTCWWQRGCQEDFVSLPTEGLEKTTRTPPHHMAKHHPARSEMSQSHTPWSSRHGSESPSVEVVVDVGCYTILELRARNNNKNHQSIAFISVWSSVSVCPHDRTKMAETIITKLATVIVHRESWLPI